MKIHDRSNQIVRRYSYRIRNVLILIVTCLFLNGYAVNQAMAFGERPDRAPARLIIHRIANLGRHVVVNLWIDGVPASSIMYGQTYDGLLPPGRHVLSVLPTPDPKWPTPSHMILDVGSGQTYYFTADGDGSGYLILRPPGGPERPRGR